MFVESCVVIIWYQSKRFIMKTIFILYSDCVVGLYMVNIEKYRFVTDGNSEGTLKIKAVELSLGLIFFY